MNNLLAITYAFMLGFCPIDGVAIDNVDIGRHIENVYNSTHVQFELGAELFDTVRLYAGEETLQVAYDSLFNWFPYTQSYWVGLEYYKDFNDKLSLKIGVSHKCQHPLKVFDIQYSIVNFGRTEIYLEVSGKVNIF
jgi:hypothetical protein